MAVKPNSSFLRMMLIIPIITSTAVAAHHHHHKTLVVSFHGFGQHYYDKHGFVLPWFDNFRRYFGVHTESVRSVFPTESLPNFVSIVTGLYPESHGIVGDVMYDPNVGRIFTPIDTDLTWWNAAEPIWITAKRHGLTTKTAVSAWPGGDVVYHHQLDNSNDGTNVANITADYVIPVDTTISFQRRIDQIVELMTQNDVDLAFVSHYQPGSTGRVKGTNGSAFINQLMRADWLLSYIFLVTERAGLTSRNLNLIICSDHGMMDVVRRVYLEDYINIQVSIYVNFSRSGGGGYATIWPKMDQLEPVYRTLKRAADKSNGTWSVHYKNQSPERFHYRNNNRFSPILIIGSPGTYIHLTRGEKKSNLGAGYGYDPEMLEMRPIFMSRGPDFKTGGYNASTNIGVAMETKDIYALLADLIGLDAGQLPANNASISHFIGMLKGYRERWPKQGEEKASAGGKSSSSSWRLNYFYLKLTTILSAIAIITTFQRN